MNIIEEPHQRSDSWEGHLPQSWVQILQGMSQTQNPAGFLHEERQCTAVSLPRQGRGKQVACAKKNKGSSEATEHTSLGALLRRAEPTQVTSIAEAAASQVSPR